MYFIYITLHMFDLLIISINVGINILCIFLYIIFIKKLLRKKYKLYFENRIII